jgi:hypothetical protein
LLIKFLEIPTVSESTESYQILESEPKAEEQPIEVAQEEPEIIEPVKVEETPAPLEPVTPSADNFSPSSYVEVNPPTPIESTPANQTATSEAVQAEEEHSLPGAFPIKTEPSTTSTESKKKSKCIIQ